MLFPQTHYYINHGLSLAAKVLTGGVAPLLSLAIYVFTALALYTMARRRGIAAP